MKHLLPIIIFFCLISCNNRDIKNKTDNIDVWNKRLQIEKMATKTIVDSLEYPEIEKLENWYKRIKVEILLNSEKRIDSIDCKTEDGALSVMYFNNGVKTFHEYQSLDTSQVFTRTKYGENELFELRSEISEKQIQITEGIVYDGHYYGPWTVRFESGQIMYRGYRFKQLDFGNWIYFSENGKTDSIVKEGYLNFTDSILNNKSLHTTKYKKNTGEN